MHTRTTATAGRAVASLQHRRPASTDKPKAVVQLCHGNGAYCMEFLCAQVVIPTCRPSKLCSTYQTPIDQVSESGIACMPLFLIAASCEMGYGVMYRVVCMQGAGKPLEYENSWIQKWNTAGISVCGHDYQGKSQTASHRPC